MEIILPCIFLGVLCLPKALVDDSVTNDSIGKPYQLSTPIHSACAPGYKVLVSPDSAEATQIATRAFVNLACDAARSGFPDAPWAGGGAGFLGEVLQCASNREVMADKDPALYATLQGSNDALASTLAGVASGQSPDGSTTAAAMVTAACADACLRDASCYANAWGSAIVPSVVRAFASSEESRAWVNSNPGATLFALDFASGVDGASESSSSSNAADTDHVRYSLSVNQTGYSSDEYEAYLTREFYAGRWEAEAQTGYWRYGVHFLRAQNAVDQAVIDSKDGGEDFGVTLDVSVRQYPWRGYDYNLGGIIAAGVFSILGALAFMSNAVIIMKSVVVEKELRLREGMEMMGCSANMYWASWFFTHWSTAMVTVVLLCVIGVYPFEYTNPFMQFIFYGLWVTSLIMWNYALSTVFSRSITASVVGCFLYVMSIAPAIAVRITEERGGASWLLVCLLPGSSINQWGSALATLELAKEGITFASASLPLTKEGNVTAWGIVGVTALDCVLYAALTWYLDKVWPNEYGQTLPPWFLFTKKYWVPDRSRGAREEEDGLLDDSGASASKNRDDDDGDDDDDSGNAPSRASNFEPLTEAQKRRGASVKVRGLRKQFDNGVVAVDDLNVTFIPGQVSGLLGHNGAGKTTTIGILTGMLEATAGDATIMGRSVRDEMPAIRASLGICPQFDVLWPTLTCREHLRLYAAFGGMPAARIEAAVVSALAEVALTEKVDYPAGALSGGQRRKLSLAVAFIGAPEVAFLDEPTSGMDPYSRRFTWEVIRRRAATSSIVLTTHFLDEADLLCDRVAIMSAGALACVGTPLFLKNRYGTGYRLTLARGGGKQSSTSEERQNTSTSKAAALIRAVVPDAELASDVGAELSFTLPTSDAPKFAKLFAELDKEMRAIGFDSYGISCTTLEEVFLSIARGGVGGPTGAGAGAGKALAEEAAAAAEAAGEDAEAGSGLDLKTARVQGARLIARQCRGLLWKRLINWRRDAWSVLIQIVVPVLFFVLALVLAGLEFTEDTEFSDLGLVSRARFLGGKPTIVGGVATSDAETIATLAQWASGAASVRGPHDGAAAESAMDCSCNCPSKDSAGREATFTNAACCAHDAATAFPAAVAAGFSADFQGVASYCAGWTSTASAAGTCGELGLGMDATTECAASAAAGTAAPTFDEYLWSVLEPNTVCKDQGVVGCDAMLVDAPYDAGAGVYRHTAYAHQSAYHGLSATINSANSAILRRRTSGSSSGIEVTHAWLPDTTRYEDGEQVNNPNDSTFITSLFVVMGCAVLTSSVVIFPVHERRNNSKHLQMVSGIDKTAYWFCHWFADLAQMSLPVCAIMIVFAAFDVDNYDGELVGVFALLVGFIVCAIPYTHLLGFYFENEFYAFVGLVGAKMFLGVVASATGMVLWAIRDLDDKSREANRILSILLPIVIPHYSFAKGLYDLGQNNLNAKRLVWDETTRSARSVGTKSWTATDVAGDDLAYLFGLAALWAALVLAVELGEGRIADAFAKGMARIQGRGADADADATEDDPEDEDVAAERRRVEHLASGGFRVAIDDENPSPSSEDPESNRPPSDDSVEALDGVVLQNLSKTFGAGRNEKRAVRDLSVGMARGQCFGLLGINGAGKTSTFRMITGEFAPTRGDTRVLAPEGDAKGYVSVHDELSRARRAMGYCPQFDGLQPNMTGREHLQFYAQIRGVPTRDIDGVVNRLVRKMSLEKYADRAAGTYSGGNKRKLSVAVALVGEPSVVLLDEPTTGMDPEARRFTWDVISASTRGRTVVLTSHSMEECEALCNRIGIMVGGAFSCLGSVQHLKNRFSEGYSVELRFQAGRGSAVYEAIAAENLPGMEVVEAHQTELKLRVQDPSAKLGAIFAAVEKLRTAPAPPDARVVEMDRNDGPGGDEGVARAGMRVSMDDGHPGTAGAVGVTLVDDYSVSQTTLEQVFVRFAARQRQERGRAPGMGGADDARFRGEDAGAFAAMDDEQGPPRRKRGCCEYVCCCGCCC